MVFSSLSYCLKIFQTSFWDFLHLLLFYFFQDFKTSLFLRFSSFFTRLSKTKRTFFPGKFSGICSWKLSLLLCSLQMLFKDFHYYKILAQGLTLYSSSLLSIYNWISMISPNLYSDCDCSQLSNGDHSHCRPLAQYSLHSYFSYKSYDRFPKSIGATFLWEISLSYLLGDGKLEEKNSMSAVHKRQVQEIFKFCG